jgi:hypothetical protein
MAVSFVWKTWNLADSTTASTTIWDYWCDTTSTSTTVDLSDATWNTWTADYTFSAVETAEQKAYRLEQERLWAEKREADRVKRLELEAKAKEAEAEARKRATVLLLSNLNAKQRQDYLENKAFHVDILGSDKKPAKRYLIKHGTHQNVFLLDENGNPKEGFCSYPLEQIPVEDFILGQKLMLECAEDDFLKVANRTVLRQN